MVTGRHLRARYGAKVSKVGGQTSLVVNIMCLSAKFASFGDETTGTKAQQQSHMYEEEILRLAWRLRSMLVAAKG